MFFDALGVEFLVALIYVFVLLDTEVPDKILKSSSSDDFRITHGDHLLIFDLYLVQVFQCFTSFFDLDQVIDGGVLGAFHVLFIQFLFVEEGGLLESLVLVAEVDPLMTGLLPALVVQTLNSSGSLLLFAI